MKRKVKILIPFILVLIFSQTLKAQNKNNQIITDTIMVSGVCSMCEERIENAALLKGVKKVEWQKDTHTLIVVYKEDKIDIDQIAASVAAAGHDNEIINSTDDQYDKVHSCCKYREDNHNH